MMFNYFQGWIDVRSVDMSESSNELLDLVATHFEELQAAATPRNPMSTPTYAMRPPLPPIPEPPRAAMTGRLR
jgi:hypothetical protein